MAQLLSYSIFSGIILLVLYITYRLVCAGERQHDYNRILILLIYAISFGVFPIYQLIKTDTSNALLPTVTIALPNGMVSSIVSTGNISIEHTPNIIFNIILWIYFIGMCATLVHTLWVSYRIYYIIHNGKHIECGKYTLIITDSYSLSPFSWYKYIVITEKDFADSAKIIISHESEHLDNRHWIDLIIAQIAIIFEWYNPASWLMLEEMKTLHEYQADKHVLDSGINPKDYQLLLIKKAVGERFPSLTNSLNQSKLKKRITMMYNQKSSMKRRFRSLALVPAFAFALGVINMPMVASTISEAADATLSTSGTNPSTDSKVNKKSAIGNVTVISNDTVIYMQRPASGGIRAEEIINAIPDANSISVISNNTSDNVSVVKVNTNKKGSGKKIVSAISTKVNSSDNMIIIYNDTVISMQRPKGTNHIKVEDIIKALPEGVVKVEEIKLTKNDTIYVK